MLIDFINNDINNLDPRSVIKVASLFVHVGFSPLAPPPLAHRANAKRSNLLAIAMAFALSNIRVTHDPHNLCIFTLHSSGHIILTTGD